MTNSPGWVRLQGGVQSRLAEVHLAGLGVVVDAGRLHHLEVPVELSLEVLAPDADDDGGVEPDGVIRRDGPDAAVAGGTGFLGRQEGRRLGLVVERSDDVLRCPAEPVAVLTNHREAG